MRHLSAVAIVVLLVILPSCKYFREHKLFGKKDNIIDVWKAKQDSIRVADSLLKVRDELMAVEKSRLDSVLKADEIRRAMEGKYNIIVGSFITPGYAENFSEVCKKQGYSTQIIKMTGSRFELVSVESHKTLREASVQLRILQEAAQIEAWIYIKE
jgi:hypothetical protein